MTRTCPDCGNTIREDPAGHKPQTQNGTVTGIICLRNPREAQG